MNLGRRSPDTTADDGATVDVVDPVGKGRPTPKRSDARKARRQPAPANRKEAAAAQRQKSREARQRTRQALVTGDESNLPPRDAGPERRLARDIVDSRFSLGQVFFVVVFVAFAASLIPNRVANFASTVVALLALTVMVVDSAQTGRKAKLAVMEKFGVGEIRGISSYAFMRAFLPRRFRRPPPKINRGDKVR